MFSLTSSRGIDNSSSLELSHQYVSHRRCPHPIRVTVLGMKLAVTDLQAPEEDRDAGGNGPSGGDGGGKKKKKEKRDRHQEALDSGKIKAAHVKPSKLVSVPSPSHRGAVTDEHSRMVGFCPSLLPASNRWRSLGQL